MFRFEGKWPRWRKKQNRKESPKRKAIPLKVHPKPKVFESKLLPELNLVRLFLTGLVAAKLRIPSPPTSPEVSPSPSPVPDEIVEEIPGALIINSFNHHY